MTVTRPGSRSAEWGKSGVRFSANAAGTLGGFVGVGEQVEAVEGEVGEAGDVLGVGVEGVLEELQRRWTDEP